MLFSYSFLFFLELLAGDFHCIDSCFWELLCQEKSLGTFRAADFKYPSGIRIAILYDTQQQSLAPRLMRYAKPSRILTFETLGRTLPPLRTKIRNERMWS